MHGRHRKMGTCGIRFTPGTMEKKHVAAGFSAVEFLSPAEAGRRYFRNRPNDWLVPPYTSILSAMMD